MFQILVAILLLGVLVIVHETGHFLVARLSKMRVDLFSIGFGPSLWRFTRGETTYQIAAVPLGGFVQIAGLNPGEDIDAEDPRAYPNRPVWQRLATIFAGPGINYVFAAFLFILLNLIAGVRIHGQNGAFVGEVLPNTPAARVGIQPGDEILSINGKAVTAYSQVRPLVDASQGKPVAIEMLREKAHKTFTLNPQKDDTGWRVGIGLMPREARQHMGAWPAIKSGLSDPVVLTWLNLQAFWDAFNGKKKLEFHSPIKIVTEIKKNINRGWVQGIEFVAFISTLLGFFNLLPFPALDGGRLVFLGWEVLTRRPVSPKVEQWVHFGGMMILFGVLGLLLFKDAKSLIVSGS